MDYIEIKNLTVFARHGVFPEEEKLGQRFYLSAKLYLNTRLAGNTDDLSESVNYAKVCEEMYTFFSEHTCQLIEAAAEHLAEHLLLSFPLVNRISLCVRKPAAPVPLSFEDISVTIFREWHTAYIGLGSNMGNRTDYLKNAVFAFMRHPLCRDLCASKFYETEPYGYTDQDSFLNSCLRVQTLLSPTELLKFAHELEQEAGRVRTIHWGPRTLDVDLLFYDQLITNDPDLVLPHPEIEKRMFVLEPLCDVDPYLVHPLLQKRICTLKEALEKQLVVN